MRQKIQEQINPLKNQIESLEKIKKELNETKTQLLELTASSFEVDPDGKYNLAPSYLRALTDILLSKEKEQLEFHECIIKSDGVEVSVEDKIEALLIVTNACEFVREAAKRKLKKPSLLEQLRDHIAKAQNMFTVYSILATNDKIMDAKEVAARVGKKGWTPTKAKNNLNDLLRDRLFTHKLIRRVDKGKYQVSDVGRVLWKEFFLSKEKSINKEKPSQVVLNTWAKFQSK